MMVWFVVVPRQACGVPLAPLCGPCGDGSSGAFQDSMLKGSGTKVQ